MTSRANGVLLSCGLKIGNVTCIIAAACMAYLPLENHWGRLVAFWFTALQRFFLSFQAVLNMTHQNIHFFFSIGFSLGLAMVSVNIGGCESYKHFEKVGIDVYVDTKKVFTVKSYSYFCF